MKRAHGGESRRPNSEGFESWSSINLNLPALPYVGVSGAHRVTDEELRGRVIEKPERLTTEWRALY